MNPLTARTGATTVGASAVAFGAGTAVSVVALRVLRPADLLVVELGGSALVLLAVAAASGRLHRRGALRALAQGALSPGLSFLLGDLGLARTTATSGSLLLGTETLITVVLAVLVLRERLAIGTAVALGLGLAGTALVSVGAGAPAEAATASDPLVGNLLVVAAVAAGAAYVVWSRGRAQAPEEGLGLTAWQFTGAATAVTPFVVASWATGGSRLAVAGPGELTAAAAVLACGLGGLVLFNLGIHAVTASRAGLLASLQPVAGALTGVAVLQEPLGAGQALGGALILVGLLVLARVPDPAEPVAPIVLPQGERPAPPGRDLAA
jgi:drug/metabolite transporter (DMT)-like permease